MAYPKIAPPSRAALQAELDELRSQCLDALERITPNEAYRDGFREYLHITAADPAAHVRSKTATLCKHGLPSHIRVTIGWRKEPLAQARRFAWVLTSARFAWVFTSARIKHPPGRGDWRACASALLWGPGFMEYYSLDSLFYWGSQFSLDWRMIARAKLVHELAHVACYLTPGAARAGHRGHFRDYVQDLGELLMPLEHREAQPSARLRSSRWVALAHFLRGAKSDAQRAEALQKFAWSGWRVSYRDGALAIDPTPETLEQIRRLQGIDAAPEVM